MSDHAKAEEGPSQTKGPGFRSLEAQGDAASYAPIKLAQDAPTKHMFGPQSTLATASVEFAIARANDALITVIALVFVPNHGEHPIKTQRVRKRSLKGKLFRD